ncbi:HlyD family secretion protein [Defluviimonas sp. WL0002]|uniref:HlyD family secretion protein n=1 Tax=Albidovulum marisflavi TaxID=2984159 RepID=A0ABT2ZES6_9RHOB|nr:HlyD family secretion protein [Defluviimonas sp. WL0002]MCV2869640.1 HlyD family secretion protein [Defluviimonas sp. WL0002]
MPRRQKSPALRGSILLGLVALSLFVGATVPASVFMSIDGALILSGRVQNMPEPVQVQVVDGGVLLDVTVSPGQRVRQGETVARLDASSLAAERDLLRRERFEAALRREVYLAEKAGRATLDLTCCGDATVSDPVWASARRAAALDLFDARRDSRRADMDVLIAQLQDATSRREGLEAERTILERRVSLAARDRAQVARLADAGLALAYRVGALEREEADIAGAIARLDAAIHQAQRNGQAAAQEIDARRASWRRETEESLAEADHEAVLLGARIAEVDRRIARSRIVAPVGGTVVDQPPVPGAVLAAGQVVVTLAPAGAALRVIAPIDPGDMDAVRSGQPARLRLTAFSGAMTPEIPARLEKLSVMPLTDERSGRLYYEARFKPEAAALESLPRPGLLSAMPVEIFVRTEPRTPLTFLSRALSDYFARALRGG